MAIVSSYAYIHCRPDGTPFYVGKGTEKRANSLVERNEYYGKVVKKHGALNILKGSLPCSSDKIAFDLEKGIIKCLKRMGVKLTNMTNGGDGFETGHIPWNRGGSLSDEMKKHLSEKNTEVMAAPERREINRQAMLGNTNRRGATHTPESIEKMRISSTGYKASDETKAKMSLAHKGNTVAKGRIHINNGEINKMVYPNQIPEGFNKGRIYRRKVWL